MTKPRSQKGRSGNLPNTKPTCAKCGKGNLGECLVRTGYCFCCANSVNNFRDFPNIKGQKKGGQAKATFSNEVPKKKFFYALGCRGEQKTSPDVVTGRFKVFPVDVNSLLDPSATLSFITSLVAKMFNYFPDILNEPFIVSSPVGESIIAKRVYRNFPIMLPNRVSYVEPVELDMLDFDIILGMDWLHAHFASIDCSTRVVKFNFPNEVIFERKRGNFFCRCCIISCLKACKMISKGCVHHIVRVQDLDSEIPLIELVPVVRWIS